ncbi:MAG: Txe/YoeB family addiction module toxin [Bacteroidales bacterium]
MNKKFFLHTTSLLVDDIAIYKNGLEKLNYASSKNDKYDTVLKHVSIYQNPLYLELISSEFSEVSSVLKYIEQCSSNEIDIVNDTEFEKYYPLENVGFMGVDFSSSSDIDPLRQITNCELCTRAKNLFYKKTLINGDRQHIEMCVRNLYTEYTFEASALDDIEYWQNSDKTTLSRVIELIDDIKANPFTGGLGQTEVLRYQNGVASKRINYVDRVTYSLNKGKGVIYRCRSHYE